ncbi:MAG: GNAT family N-acetyltransferase [Phycisphaerae bacterium]
MQPIQTARLLIRRIEDADLPFLVTLLGDATAMAYWPRPYTPVEAGQWVQQQRERYASHGFGYWTAVEAAGGEPVGQVGVLPHHFNGRDEVGLGWIIAPSHWRRGLAAEAGAACIGWALAHTQAERIVALIRPENTPSAGVAQKLGLVRGEQVVHHTFPHDVWYHTRRPGSLASPHDA